MSALDLGLSVARRMPVRLPGPVDPDAAAFVARQAGHSLSSGDVAALDNLIAALKSAGVWARCDQLLWFNPALPNGMLSVKGASSDAAATGVVRPIASNPSLFVDGAAGNGIAARASNAGGQFSQDSASFGAWLIEGSPRAATVIGDSINRNFLSGASSTNGPGRVVARINSNANLLSTGSVASGDGFTLVNRTGANATSLWKSGTRIGTGTEASAAVTANPIRLGLGNGQAQGFALWWMGGGLSDAQAGALTTAIDSFIAATGVRAIRAVARTQPMSAALTLPDASGIGDAGRGLPCTGLAALPDGRWLVGVGLATPSTAAGVAVLSTDARTIEMQCTYAAWGMTAYSTQGVAVEGGGIGLCVAKNPGTEARLVRFDLVTGARLSDALLPSAGSNGLAFDAVRDRLIVSDSAANLVRWHRRDTLAIDPSIPAISFSADQLCHHAPTDTLLMTGGANGADGLMQVHTTRDYGGFWLKQSVTLAGSLAVEGVAIAAIDGNAATILIADDGHTHSTGYDRNRLHRYEGVPI